MKIHLYGTSANFCTYTTSFWLKPWYFSVEINEDHFEISNFGPLTIFFSLISLARTASDLPRKRPRRRWASPRSSGLERKGRKEIHRLSERKEGKEILKEKKSPMRSGAILLSLNNPIKHVGMGMVDNQSTPAHRPRILLGLFD